jgi:hypothetical protein
MFWHRPKKSIARAIQSGDHVKLRKLVSGNPREAKSTGPGGEPLLFLGIASGKTEIVKILLTAGASVNEEGPGGDTPLVRSFTLRTPDIAKLLLAAGADPNQTGAPGVPPVHIAVYKGRADLLRLLLDAGVDLGRTDPAGASVLAAAVESNQSYILRALLQAGAGKGRTAELQALCEKADAKGQFRIASAIRKALDAVAGETHPEETAQVFRGRQGGRQGFIADIAMSDTAAACMEHLACTYSAHVGQQRIYASGNGQGTGNLQVAFEGIAVSCGAIRLAGGTVARQHGQTKPYRYADLNHVLGCCCGDYRSCPFYEEATMQRSAV